MMSLIWPSATDPRFPTYLQGKVQGLIDRAQYMPSALSGVILEVHTQHLRLHAPLSAAHAHIDVAAHYAGSGHHHSKRVVGFVLVDDTCADLCGC